MASSYDSDKYLNSNIDKRNKKEKQTDEIVAWYIEEYGNRPSAANLRKEINRLNRWLYKGKNHIAFIKKIKVAERYITAVGYKEYYYEEVAC